MRVSCFIFNFEFGDVCLFWPAVIFVFERHQKDLSVRAIDACCGGICFHNACDVENMIDDDHKSYVCSIRNHWPLWMAVIAQTGVLPLS